MFINKVFASEIVGSSEVPTFGSFTASLVPLLIFIAVFYFLLIRPQQKKQKAHEEEVASLKVGDRVLTSGGLFGNVRKVKEEILIVEIADGVEIEVLAQSVNLIKKENSSLKKEKKVSIEKKEIKSEKIKKAEKPKIKSVSTKKTEVKK